METLFGAEKPGIEELRARFTGGKVAVRVEAEERGELTREEVLGLATGSALFRMVRPGQAPEDLLDGRVTFGWVVKAWPGALVRQFGGYLAHLDGHAAAGRGLVMEGICGSGKTGALLLVGAAIAARYGSVLLPPLGEQRVGQRERLRVAYRPMPALMTFLLQRDTAKDEAWEEEWSTLLGCRHLLLDEVGTQYSEGFATNRLFTLLDTRLQSQRSTYMATNGLIADLKADAIGARLYHRLKAKCFRLTLPDVDHRKALDAGEIGEF